MIDTATVERWIRETNPIRDLDEVDPDELAYAVTAVHTRRAAIMQAPTQHPTAASPGTSPPSRRRKAWAFAAGFVVVLLVVGVAALLLRNDEARVADQPVTPTTVTTPEAASEAADEPEVAPPVDPEAPVVVDGWQQVATSSEQPWVRGIHQIEPLPGGGYVAAGGLDLASVDPSSVMWSPNGVDWFDGDPQRLVERSPRLPSLAAVGDQVVVLYDSSLGGVALSIGDPRAGTWERVPLDVTGIEGRLREVRLAANDTAVLVAAYAAPARAVDRRAAASTQVMVWVVDAARGTSTRNSFSIPATLLNADAPLIEWVEEQWIMIAFEDVVGPEPGDLAPIPAGAQRNTLWTSPDGRSWTQVALAEGMGGVHSVTAGPSGVVAGACSGVVGAYKSAGDGWWYSSDGLEWSFVPQPESPWHANPVIASLGDRGFVVWGLGDLGVQLVASDGSGIELMPSPFRGTWTAAASGDTVIALSSERKGLWLYQEPPNE